HLRGLTSRRQDLFRQVYFQDTQQFRRISEEEFPHSLDNGYHLDLLKASLQDYPQEPEPRLGKEYLVPWMMAEDLDGLGALSPRRETLPSEKVLRSLGWEMQVDFEHLSEAELVAPTYLDSILKVMNLKAGVRDDDEKRQAFRDVIHGAARKKDENLGQFATRRLRDFAKAATYGITLPPEFRVSLMKEGAGLSDQNLQNLAVLTQGREMDVDFLAAAMARMDVRADRLSGYAEAEPRASLSFAEGMDDPRELEQGESEEEESLDDEVVLSELEDLNFSEDQAQMVFAILENRPPRRRRTWKENKMFKAEARKDRKPFRKGDALPEGGPPGGSGFCGLTASEWGRILAAARATTGSGTLEPLNFLTLKSGTAILDIGATQDLIGECALAALGHVLAEAGLKYVDVPVDSHGPPTGIGGAATVTRAVLVPISPGGVPGVVHFTVIKENVPPLLSVGLLEHLGAMLDLVDNKVHFKSINVVRHMQKEASGHRTISLVEWDGALFPVPKEARERFGPQVGGSRSYASPSLRVFQLKSEMSKPPLRENILCFIQQLSAL
ncbi:unnamed protein product, partial [Symbiodinium necroappetens]